MHTPYSTTPLDLGDLVRIGYRARKVFGVYALNLLLVPVHLGGILKSVARFVTGKHTRFGRTPKVAERIGSEGESTQVAQGADSSSHMT